MQAYTKYDHCSLYSSKEMNLNIRVKVGVDTNVDRMMDERIENRIPISLHAKSKQDNNRGIRDDPSK